MVHGVAAKEVLSFRGVPYGGPTEGENRFMPPTKPTPWTGIREAVKAGPRAIQTGDKNIFSAPLLASTSAVDGKMCPTSRSSPAVRIAWF